MRCNRACSYCFAKEKLHSYAYNKVESEISIENLNKVTEFLSRSKCDSIQLAGGEPTIHPKFKEILLTLLDKRISINLLTNAMWNSELNVLFDQASPTSLGFLLNIDKPTLYNIQERQRLEENLEFLSKRGNVTLSFNFFEKKPDYDYIFEMVKKYGFKNLRLSFSMPVKFEDKTNIHLNINDYKEMAKYVIDFVHKAEELGATVGMDNAVPICMFNPEQLSELMIKQVVSPARNFVCYPAIDIGPDLSVWRCFGTSKLFNKKLDEFKTLSDMYDYYQRASRLYQFKFFPLQECETCNYAKNEQCQGGCIGFAEAKSEELGITVSDSSDKELLNMKPMLSEEISIRKYSLPIETATINFHDGYEMEIPTSIAELIPFFNGKTTIQQVLQTSICGNSGPQEDDSISELLLEMSSKEIIPILRRLIDRKVLLLK
jgi:organic radical activating enzyme